MAIGATNRLLIISQGMMRQIKSSIAPMIEILPFQAGWPPGDGGVAKLAARVKKTQMQGWLSVTGNALSGEIAEVVYHLRGFHQRAAAGLSKGVAAATGQRSVLTFQREGG